VERGKRGLVIGYVVKTTGDWLREQGAAPNIIPSMGSHNEATEDTDFLVGSD